ncbi:hypothetical protein AB0B94_32130 [Micromonospora sp. NPDC048986]|uniref:hypothetical protein n=1 Tax=Micromonospora sp. NPDC048986 TaxID=3155644 RepID=UPI0033E6A347
MRDAMSIPNEELLVSVAAATRVTSLLPIFLERLDRPFATDTLDPKQGVELRWRELTGFAQSGALEMHLKDSFRLFTERIRASSRPGFQAAAAAIDVISTLLDRSVDDVERCCTIAGQALRIAMEMDRASAPLPDSQQSWAAFELRAQARVFELVAGSTAGFSPQFIDNVREEAGMQSMFYRNGMKALGTR